MAKNEIPAEGALTIIVGDVYKEDGGNKEVIPFNVDFGSSTVQFAPVRSGREDRMRTSDFLNRFKHQGSYSETAESQEKAPGESTARKVSRDAGTVSESKDKK